MLPRILFTSLKGKEVESEKKQHKSDVKYQQYLDRLSTRAKPWGTSAKSIEHREGMVKDLTNFQDYYHEKINILINRQEQLQDRINTKRVMNDNNSHYQYKGYTSDDTKQLELCPHKRQHTNLSVSYSGRLDSAKKLRPHTPTKEDHRPSSLVFSELDGISKYQNTKNINKDRTVDEGGKSTPITEDAVVDTINRFRKGIDDEVKEDNKRWKEKRRENSIPTFELSPLFSEEKLDQNYHQRNVDS
ncbi:hypothetical protein C1646_750177 [Rhizophagus diaphanus]|nr:hypothetical protein C1646_750177 [Rhizophagus diaphanus] [Rhizophagus sp. MUCL 43196]